MGSVMSSWGSWDGEREEWNIKYCLKLNHSLWWTIILYMFPEILWYQKNSAIMTNVVKDSFRCWPVKFEIDNDYKYLTKLVIHIFIT